MGIFKIKKSIFEEYYGKIYKDRFNYEYFVMLPKKVHYGNPYYVKVFDVKTHKFKNDGYIHNDLYELTQATYEGKLGKEYEIKGNKLNLLNNKQN